MESFGEDWIDSDYKMTANYNRNVIDPLLIVKPLSKERQEKRNQRLESEEASSKDSVDGMLVPSRYKTYFNANTRRYNHFTDNTAQRNSKRDRFDDDEPVGSRTKRHSDREKYSNYHSSERRYDDRRKHTDRNRNRNRYDEEEMEAKRKQMLTNGAFREIERKLDVEMYVEASLREEQAIQQNLNRIHAIRS